MQKVKNQSLLDGNIVESTQFTIFCCFSGDEAEHIGSGDNEEEPRDHEPLREQVICDLNENGYTYKGGNPIKKCFCLPCHLSLESTLKGRNLLLKSIFFFFFIFLLGRTPFSKGLGIQEREQEVTEIVSLGKNCK